jgi:hypothetical protein
MLASQFAFYYPDRDRDISSCGRLRVIENGQLQLHCDHTVITSHLQLHAKQPRNVAGVIGVLN